VEEEEGGGVGGSAKISMRLLPSPLGRARGARGRRAETGKREGVVGAGQGGAAAAHPGGVVFYLRTRALRCGLVTFFSASHLQCPCWVRVVGC
jgi:hypothetical protein